MKENIQLPEKDFFTIEEVCLRFDAPRDLIEHYIFDKKILRVAAIKTRARFYGAYFYEVDQGKYDVSDLSAVSISLRVFPWEVDEVGTKAKKIFKCFDERRLKSSFPKYMYIPTEGLKSLSTQDVGFWLFNDFEGNLYSVIDEGPPESGLDMIGCFLTSRLFVPLEELQRFESKYRQNSLPSIVTDEREGGMSPKTENCYLRTIKALCELASNGLTGKDYSDAEIVLAALRAKNIDSPVSSKMMARYLGKAKKL